MSLLSSSRLEAIRLIREQLRCTLCGDMFQDPQCLDCKHNFCRPCILLHLKQNHTQCPSCQLPTRPSEVTRNQFLESILAAWKGVEAELEALDGDRTLHAQQLTVQDTDKALHRAASGSAAAGSAEDEKQEERHSSRGRVGNHKWHIDTQEIRHELKLEQPYLPQHYGRAGSTAHWKKTSSSDLPDDYGGSSSNGRSESKESEKPPVESLDEASVMETESREEAEEKEGVASPQSNSLMATQEVESYLERINKQREALSQWERNHGSDGGSSSLLDLERSLHNSTGFDELVKERRRESLQHDEDGDLLTQMTQMTQMPPATSALESPDLLASFRRRSHSRTSENHDRRPGLKAKRRVLLASPPPLHPQGQMPSPSRKRLRIPDFQASDLTTNGHSSASAIDLSQNDSDDDRAEVPDSQPATMLSDDEEEEEDKQSEYEPSEEEEEEEEYEMKPAAPLPPTPDLKSSAPTLQCERLRHLFTIKKERVSDDFRSAVTAFQSEEKPVGDKSPGAATEATRTNSSKPPMHTSNGSTRIAVTSEGSSFVFVSSDLNREEVKRVLEATQRLGGKFGHDFDLKHDPTSGHFCTSVTHLITKTVPPIGAINGTDSNELRCKRTAKYMRALAEGTFVMDFTWVTASLAAGRWLTEEPFEMIGDIYSDAVGKPHEGRIRRVQTGRRNSIFNMFCFVLLVSEKEFDFQFASVRTLVNNFGGTVVHADKFAKLKSKQRSRRTPIGVVSKTTSPWDAKAKWHEFQIPIVRITWIFDSVSHLEVLPFDDYYPY
ncbi:hypothetical protein PRIC2_014898 [Phytophthora ramorum]